MAKKETTEKVKKLNNYPYMIAIVGVLAASVIAQILIVLDLFFPIFRMDVDAVSSVMSTCSEVIAGMYGITLTGYIFFADRFQGMSKEDESLYDIVQALLIRYNRMAGIISLMCLLCIMAGEGMVLYGTNTIFPHWLYRVLVNEILLLFFWTFDFILYFVLSVLDPMKVDRITAQKRNSLSDDDQLGDVKEFLTTYMEIEDLLRLLMEKLINSSMPIPGPGKKPRAVYTLETLRNYSRISFQQWRKLEQLRQYYNLTLHDPNMTVTREMCDLAREVKASLEEKHKNS